MYVLKKLIFKIIHVKYLNGDQSKFSSNHNHHKYLQNVYNTISIPQWCLHAFLTNS